MASRSMCINCNRITAVSGIRLGCPNCARNLVGDETRMTGLQDHEEADSGNLSEQVNSPLNQSSPGHENSDQDSDDEEGVPSPPRAPRTLYPVEYVGVGSFQSAVLASNRGYSIPTLNVVDGASVLGTIIGVDASIVRPYLNSPYIPYAAPMTLPQIDGIPKVSVTAEDVETHANCVVCCENFVVGNMVSKLRCAHIFHTECIQEWLRRCGNCPICRTMFSHPNAKNNNGTVLEDI